MLLALGYPDVLSVGGCLTDDDLTLTIRTDWHWQSRQSDIMFHRMLVCRMRIVSVTLGFGSSPQDIKR